MAAQKGKIACLLADDFEDSEFRIPADRLKQAGYELEIIGFDAGKEVVGKKGKERIKADKGIDDVRAEEYEGLFIPGGYSPDHLRIDPRMVEFVRAFDASRKTLAAVCHGPQILLTAGLVKGRTLTAWPTIQSDLRYAGANVVDREVTVDDNWVTSRKPADLDAFSAKFLEELREWEARGGPQPGLSREEQVSP
jgi:protease I